MAIYQDLPVTFFVMALRLVTFGRPSEISSPHVLFPSLALLAFTRIFPLGGVLVYSYTRMLVYSPLIITRLLVTRKFPLGGYSYTRMLSYSPLGITRLLAQSHTRSLALQETLVCSFTRLLVRSLLAALP
jgi:hypothetical protein